MESSFNCVSIAFNGHGGFGGRNEPFIEWIFSSLGPPDDQRRIDAIHMFRPMLAVAETYGLIFEVKDTDPFTGHLVIGAVCACYPPGDLEDDGSPMKIGLQPSTSVAALQLSSPGNSPPTHQQRRRDEIKSIFGVATSSSATIFSSLPPPAYTIDEESLPTTTTIKYENRDGNKIKQVVGTT